MLEQYIKNFAQFCLGLKAEYLSAISSEQGIFSLSLEDQLLCSLEEIPSDAKIMFRLTVALGQEESRDTFLLRLGQYFGRLADTPCFGPVKIVVEPEHFIPALTAELDAQRITQEDFNQFLNSFMRSAIYIANLKPAQDGAETEQIPSPCSSTDPAVYQECLAALGLDEGKLAAQCNRISLNEHFGLMLSYNRRANYLMLQNALETAGRSEQVLSLLSCNALFPPRFNLAYAPDVLYVQQALELNQTTPAEFLRCLELQESLVTAVSDRLKEYKMSAGGRQWLEMPHFHLA